jgi:hypothetical protein
MANLASLRLLKDRKAVVTDTANALSTVQDCSESFRFLGADLALNYLKDKAKRRVVYQRVCI